MPAAGLAVRYADRPDELRGARLVILPGTKNTRADLAWLRARGLDRAILDLAAAGVPVFGICGGYEMLGRAINDPLGVEGEAGSAPGLGLLPLEITFDRDKTTRQVVASPGTWLPELAGATLAAYEIHMGHAVADGAAAFSVRAEPERVDGLVQGHVVGTFLHGLFESSEFCGAIARRLGGEAPGTLQSPYARLAAHVRSHLDVPALYRIAGLPATDRVV